MIFKFIGIIIILSSCTLFGWCAKYHCIYHVKELENLSECLDIICNEITISLNDVIKSFEKCCEYASEFNCIFFKEMIATYNISNGETMSEIWNNTLEKMSTETIYNKDDIESFRSFGNLLGAGNTQTQTENIQALKENIKERLSIAKEKKDKISVVGKLGIYAGLVIVIFLI